jgi:hypothetical protein
MVRLDFEAKSSREGRSACVAVHESAPANHRRVSCGSLANVLKQQSLCTIVSEVQTARRQERFVPDANTWHTITGAPTFLP